MRKGGLLVGMAVGAGLVYLLDPQSGERRRDRLRRAIQDRVNDEQTRHLTIQMPSGHYGSRRGDIQGRASATLTRSPGPGPESRIVTLVGGALALYGLARRGMLGVAAQTALVDIRVRRVWLKAHLTSKVGISFFPRRWRTPSNPIG